MQQITRRQAILATAIVILAVGLRLYRIGVPQISHDEMCSIETSTGRGPEHLLLPRNVIISPPPNLAHLSGALPIWTIPAALHRDVHPPLYFILLRLWEDLFGDGVVTIRTLSVAASVAAIVLIFDVGRWMGGVSTGLWAALLMTVAAPQITYAQNARPYALATTLALASTDALLRIMRLGLSRRRTIALFAALAATCLTHYFAVPAAVAIAVYGLVCTTGQTRRSVAIACISAAAAVLALWAYAFWSQRASLFNPADFWYADRATGHVAAVLERAARLPIRFLADPVNSASTLAAAGAAAVLYVLPWLMCRKRPELILLGLWLIGCAGAVTILDLWRTTKLGTLLRYTLVGAPAVYLMLPTLARWRWLNNLVAAMAVVYCLINLPQAYDIETLDFSHMAAEIDRSASPGDVLLIDSFQYDDTFAGGAYMGVQRLARNLPQSIVLLQTPVPLRLLDELRTRAAGHRCFILYWMGRAPDDLLPGWRIIPIAHYPFAGTFCQLAPAT
jgi:uncharacterized membrane protein